MSDLDNLLKEQMLNPFFKEEYEILTQRIERLNNNLNDAVYISWKDIKRNEIIETEKEIK